MRWRTCVSETIYSAHRKHMASHNAENICKQQSSEHQKHDSYLTRWLLVLVVAFVVVAAAITWYPDSTPSDGATSDVPQHTPTKSDSFNQPKVLLRSTKWTDCRQTLWASQVLRRAWRRVALSAHPDKGGSAEALERSKQVLDLLGSPMR